MLHDRPGAEPRRTYRNPAFDWSAAAIPFILLPGGLALGVRLGTMSAWATLGAGYLGVSTLFVVGLRRLRVVADGDGLTVVNYISTRRIPWTEVRAIRIAVVFGSTIGTIERADGRRVRARALTVLPSTGGLAYVTQACRELEAAWHRHLLAQGVTPIEADQPSRDAWRRTDLRRAGRWLQYVSVLWLLLCLFFIGLGVVQVWSNLYDRPGVYARLRVEGIPATAHIAECRAGLGGGNGWDCALTVHVGGATTTFVYPENSDQFDGLAIGAPVAVLVDPRHRANIYTVRDVEENTNTGWGPVAWFGVVMIALGVGGLLLFRGLVLPWYRVDRALETWVSTGGHGVPRDAAPQAAPRARLARRFVRAGWIAACVLCLATGAVALWSSFVYVPGAYAGLRADGIAETARLGACTSFGCDLIVKLGSTTTTVGYSGPSDQFSGRPTGAQVRVLVDPHDPTDVYTVRDVEGNADAGWSGTAWVGVGLVAAGLLGALLYVRLLRRW